MQRAQNGRMTTDSTSSAMDPSDFPAPQEGFVLTFFLVVADQDRSREFYKSMLGGKVIFERDPVILKVANSWLILNNGGGPTARQAHGHADNAFGPEHHERVHERSGRRHLGSV